MHQKIIYLLGTGRSGTTILDIILGNDPKFFSSGELNRYLKLNGYPHNINKHDSRYEFWIQVRDALTEKSYNFEELYQISKKLEYHTAFLKKTSINKIQYLYYQNFQKDLFKILAEKSGKDFIIDSSKYPFRLNELLRIKNLDVYIVYFKRSPLDVINSFRKRGVEQPSKGWFSANLYLFIVHGLIYFLKRKFLRKERFIELSYDELIDTPVKSIIKLEYEFKLDLSVIKKIAERRGPFKTGNLFDGNRIRLQEKLFIKVKDKTQNNNSLEGTLVKSVHKFWWKN